MAKGTCGRYHVVREPFGVNNAITRAVDGDDCWIKDEERHVGCGEIDIRAVTAPHRANLNHPSGCGGAPTW